MYLDNMVLDCVRLLGCVFDLHFVRTRFVELQLTPDSRGHSNIDGIHGFSFVFSVHSINRVHPWKLPVFDLRSWLVEVKASVVPWAVVFSYNGLEVFVGIRGRIACIRVIGMKFDT